ncbi:MAG: glycogen/starch/alpha-glucan phosphorylase [Deltaproteobacteria bacterium]|nr:glycogen/starch/alpha-glucan phosphorylase [Deltaproteobacteria bacterium]
MSTAEQPVPSRPPRIEVRVEDDRTGMDPVTFKRAITDHLRYTQSKTERNAHRYDWYVALAHAVRDRAVHRWIKTAETHHRTDAKRIYYLSAEFLPGRFLQNNLINLGLYDIARKVLAELEVDLDDILEEEVDPGLGNGGLGRLAACFLDSMATLGYAGMGHGIRYEFGIFHQEIKDGRQLEQPDEWLRYGFPWEIVRPDEAVTVGFGGHVDEFTDRHGRLRVRWTPATQVIGVPHDTPVVGYGNDSVLSLRLWRARASEEFDLQVFNDGDYRKAVEEKAISESISKVLYPNDQSFEGKVLRLKQQYFFSACAIHDIVLRYLSDHVSFDEFPDKVAIQLNDTHPVIAIGELMRVLLDDHGITWEKAWDITQRTFGYTNHTLLTEALERWPVSLFEKLLPRHLSIIFEINRRFLRQVIMRWPSDNAERQRRLSLVQESDWGGEKQIRMANLAVVGSHSINGVAALHSELVRTELLRDFAELWPERFNNKTNGVTPRRWLLQANPRLAHAITARIGEGWVTDLGRLERLLPLAEDAGFRAEIRRIKRENKAVLAEVIKQLVGLDLNLDSLFDVQIKRLHEYKRQLLCCMHVIALYNRIKRDPQASFVPRTVIFGGKAAPGYAMAKMHIKLINDVAEVVNKDPEVGSKLRVMFIPNYRVSLAERIFPASDLSEQISTAGKEASGTGNMKFQMNGALTIGTLDGANIEIREEVGPENFFLFGLTAQEVAETHRRGYRPADYVARSPELREVIERIASDFFSPESPGLYANLIHNLLQHDPYLVCADFDPYVACQDRAAAAYLDQEAWSRMAIVNIAKSGKFSSDRTILEYAKDIWQAEPVRVVLD